MLSFVRFRVEGVGLEDFRALGPLRFRLYCGFWWLRDWWWALGLQRVLGLL